MITVGHGHGHDDDQDHVHDHTDRSACRGILGYEPGEPGATTPTS